MSDYSIIDLFTGELMASLRQKTHELRELVEDILQQFRQADAEAAKGPHAELNMQELRLVEYLGDHGARKMRDLARFLMLAAHSVTNVVDNLEKKLLVRRQDSLEDRRVILVELTEQGRRVYESAVGEKVSLLKKMLSALTEDEQEIFMVLFRKIARSGSTRAQSASA